MTAALVVSVVAIEVSIAQGMRSPTKAILFRWSENGLIEKQGEHYVKLIK